MKIPPPWYIAYFTTYAPGAEADDRYTATIMENLFSSEVFSRVGLEVLYQAEEERKIHVHRDKQERDGKMTPPVIK